MTRDHLRAIRRRGERKRPVELASAADRMPALIAHRGWPARWPENSLEGFAAAIDAGADEIECDVWVSRDGVAVVCHDQALERTTALQGLLTDYTSDVLAGARLRHPDGSVSRFRGVPRLDAVLALAAGRAVVNVEVKDHASVVAIIETIRESLARPGAADAAASSCYVALRPVALHVAAGAVRDLPLCALSGPVHAREQIRLAARHGCRRVQLRRDDCTASLVDEAADAGMLVNCFWSDDPGEIDTLEALGVHAVLTNDVGRVRQERAERRRQGA